jgi:hypothetical protein
MASLAAGVIVMTDMVTSEKFEVCDPEVVQLSGGRYCYRAECPVGGRYAYKFTSRASYDMYNFSLREPRDEVLVTFQDTTEYAANHEVPETGLQDQSTHEGHVSQTHGQASASERFVH